MKIKRILAIVSFSALISLYITITMPKRATYISLALFALFICIHRIFADKFTKQLTLSFVSVCVAILYLSVYKTNLNAKLEKYNNIENTVLTGEVVSVKDYSGVKCFSIKANEINGEKIHNFGVNLYTGYPLKDGETVKLTGKYKTFTHKTNFIYNYSKNVYGYFYADNIKVLHNTPYTTNKFFAKIRNHLIDTAQNLYDDDTLPVVVAMGLGNKNLINNDIKQSFDYSGISHALTVSGLHVGFIALVLNFLLGYLPVNKKIKNIVLCVFIYMFMGIIGFTPSIIRAGILTIAMLMGRNFIIEIDNFTVLAVIILLTIIPNPYSATNGSLLLSYSAYFGVIFAIQYADEKGYGKIKKSMLLTSFAVLFSSPFLSFMGMNATILSPVFNIILSPVMRCICSLSFFGTVLASVPILGLVSKFVLVPVNKAFIYILLTITGFLKDNFAFALIDLGDEIVQVVIISTIVAALIAFIQFSNVKIRQIFIICVPLLTFICYNFINANIITVKAFDSGSETSFILSNRNNVYFVLAENISQKRMNQIIDYENIGAVKQIVYCPEKYEELVAAENVTDNILTIGQTDKYDFDDFSINAIVEKRKMSYKINIGDTIIAFSHKSTDLSDENIDFYFFGSDTPKALAADNVYYFYPLLKKHTDMAAETDAYQLFDTFTFRVNYKNGKYKITEDVKNFGS